MNPTMQPGAADRVAATAARQGPFPPAGYAAYVIAVLWTVTLFSQLDRQLPALIVQPLRDAFDISDTQFSLLQGYAFAIFYTVMGIPFGRLVDRKGRRTLIMIGVVVWSTMTVLSGFATSYIELLVLRMGVGVGEAVLAPAAYSMIADYVPPSRRGRALSFYYVSLAIGSGASLLLGGLLFGLLPDEGAVLPGVGAVERWQAMFIFAGLPGFALALLLLSVREPDRQELRLAQTDPSFAAFLRHLAAHRATFGRLFTYPAVVALIGYALLAWAPAHFQRQFGMPTASTGVIVGVIVAAGGMTGTLISGYLSDLWLSRGVPGARFRVTLVSWALILPTACVWPLVPSETLGLALLGISIVGFSLGQAAAPAVIQDVVPNRMRGVAVATYLLLGGLLGIGLGPTSVALLTDYVFQDDNALRYSLAAVALPMSLLGTWLCLSGQRPYANTFAELHRQ